MPDPIEPAPEAPVPGAPALGTPGKTDALGTLDKLKKKYRLDAEVNLFARDATNAAPLGKGPLLDPEVFNKFASLDHTPSKKYLDWMLFQAGGGADGFAMSRENWGDNEPVKTPESFFQEFQQAKPDHVIRREELTNIARLTKSKGLDIDALLNVAGDVEDATTPDSLTDRFHALVTLMRQLHIVPGKEERVAAEMIMSRFKAWIKNQNKTKTRDRVHATSVLSGLVRGVSREDAERKWKEMEPKRRIEYIYGDQDSLKWNAFGYNRFWPGRDGIYERIYEAMGQFILNTGKVERYNSKLEQYNAAIKAKNQTLPPDQQLPEKSPLNFDVNIGKVLVDKHGNLSYKGPYPSIRDLTNANEEVTERPLKDQVAQDVRYAGPKGAAGRTAKLYSDANLDVMVPLTVAASIKAGTKDWPISSPNQLSNVKAKGSYSNSTWTAYATGNHNFAEWNTSRAIPIYFAVKTPGVPDAVKRLLMLGFLDDLTDLKSPYNATQWYVSGTNEKLSYADIIRLFQMTRREDQDSHTAYLSIVHSFANAMRTIRNWGKEFDPHDMVDDYVAHHRERLSGKRTLGEEVQIRAFQAVEALLE